MAKAKTTYNTGGYSTWGVRRTLTEAENAARWSPWSAVEWMEEARDQISIENPLYDEFDAVANRINALWRSYERYHWYDAKSFWRKGTVSYPPQRIKLITEQTDDYISINVSDLFKI